MPTHKKARKRTKSRVTVADDVFRRYGLTRVINVSGTETTKGASPVCRDVRQAVEALVPHCVDMLELQSVACATIAKAFQAEAGMVAHCSAAGIVVGLAACMTGNDLDRIARLPDCGGMKNEVIVQRGHNINYGGRIDQTIAVTGAKVVAIGTSDVCTVAELDAAISARTAAALFVVSHHVTQRSPIPIEEFCRVCGERGVPVVVDAAAEPDPRPYLRAGADLVIVSMHKQFAALTAAAVAGRLPLVRACLLQETGIGRSMKAAKECVMATIAAVERWRTLDHRAAARNLQRRLQEGRKRLGRVPGLRAENELDATSRQFSRLLLTVDFARAGIDAEHVAERLAAEDPSIVVRMTAGEPDKLRIDLRRATDAVAEHVFRRIEQVVAAAGRNEGGAAAVARSFPVVLRRANAARAAKKSRGN